MPKEVSAPCTVPVLVTRHTIHASQELCDNTPLHLALRTFAFWCYGIYLVNEQEAWSDTLEATVSNEVNARVTIRTFASSNVSLSVFSDSPDIPDTIEGAEMLMNGTASS